MNPLIQSTPELLARVGSKNGESPLWDERRGLLLWSDIPEGRLFSLDPNSGRVEVLYEDEPVGGFTLQEDGSLLLFRVNNIARFWPGQRPQVLAEGIDEEMERFNDCIADPQGRVFVGTMGKDEQPTGALFRVDCDGSVTKLFAGTPISNGMAFSPDARTFYWTDTLAHTLFAFDYDAHSGELSNRRVLLLTPDDEGQPDGLATDAEGSLWSARFGGDALFRYAPDGSLLERVPLPVSKVTSLIFGGPQLRDVYITTSGGEGYLGQESPALDGALFRMESPVTGREEFRSRVRLES